MLSTLVPFETDLFLPTYRPFEGERWAMVPGSMVLCRGYWSEAKLMREMAGLLRYGDKGLDDAQVWMSLTPMEIESQEIGCRFAAGHTLVHGLGMGWAAANAAINPAVTRVTVVEFDPEVIQVVSDMGVFAQLPPEAGAKVTVVRGDAHAHVPPQPVDTLMADIWRPINTKDRDAEVRRMRANCGASRVYYWGQELDIARRAKADGWDMATDLDASTIDRIIADFDLPLIGPAEMPNYANLLSRAARIWLRDV